MTGRIPEAVHDMTPETIAPLQELIQALKDSVDYHTEASNEIDDEYVKSTFQRIAMERNAIHESIGGMVSGANEQPAEEGTWLGSLRTTWTAFRSGLNSGDATVVLIEAERAEDAIVKQFKTVLPQIAGNPVNDKLLNYFETVKSGHDRVRALRNAYQNA